jgi:hypothetical protein
MNITQIYCFTVYEYYTNILFYSLWILHKYIVLQFMNITQIFCFTVYEYYTNILFYSLWILHKYIVLQFMNITLTTPHREKYTLFFSVLSIYINTRKWKRDKICLIAN